jgi:squalene synthase HpnC
MTSFTRAKSQAPTVAEAFRHCERIVREHYENFPVASLLLPPGKRPYVAALYAFARAADDIADEGSLQPEERLSLLDEWKQKLDACYAGNADDPVFVALAATVKATGIPKRLLVDLLTAFRMDITRHRYETFADLLGYCTCSANPVGRLVLTIFDQSNDLTNALSDQLCTALQLANFWQDLSIDWSRGRLYIPLEDLARFGYTEGDISAGSSGQRFKSLMQFQVQRTRELFQAGYPLVDMVSGRLRFELRLTYNGGMAILRKIEALDYDVLHGRPALGLGDRVALILTTVLGSLS